MAGSEPADAIRAVNALLTRLDQLKAAPNVMVGLFGCRRCVRKDGVAALRAGFLAQAGQLSMPCVAAAAYTPNPLLYRSPSRQVLTTSNITEAIDLAFVDRADIKAYIGNPNEQARCGNAVWMGGSCTATAPKRSAAGRACHLACS